MLRLQRYDLIIKYKPGKEMYIADTLSRATPKMQRQTSQEEEILNVHCNHFMQNIPVSQDKLEEIKKETLEDTEMNQLRKQILKGWPANKHEVDKDIKQYFQYNEELSTIDGLIFKADKIIIPKTMRKEMLKRTHEGHLGMEKCKNRARQIMFWPGMSKQIEEIVSKCSTCITHRNKQQKEPLINHDIPNAPWQKVGTDLFHWNGHDYLLVADYYSKFPEIALLTDIKSKTVISHMKSIFARHGIPQEVVSDNGTQYTSEEFKTFSKQWEFKHTTSSPTYPKANGFAERMVQTMKNLLTKTHESGEDLYLAMLNYRSTPVNNTMPSPAELLTNRKFRTRLTLRMKPKKNKIMREMKRQQEKSKQQYDKHAKSLPDLHTQEKVYMRNKEDKIWVPATVQKKAQTPRSYIVQTDTGTYRRNRSDLLKVNTKSNQDTPIENTGEQTDADTNQNKPDSLHSSQNNENETLAKNIVSPTTKTSETETQAHEKSPRIQTPKTTRSGRVVKMPVRMKDFFM